ncbi:MAG: hypothetical protein WAS36_03190 [Candidatus Saccharimonadales bacterium]
MAVAARAEVISFQTLPEDQEARERASVLIDFTGNIALLDTVSLENGATNTFANLQEATRSARQGNERGRKMIEANVSTDVFERTVKAGFVQAIQLEVDEQGKIGQNGQSNEIIQHNTALYLGHNKVMQPRFRAETNNAFRMQLTLDTGNFDDYYFVVFSRYPDSDEMPDAVARSHGFFGETKSMMVQATNIASDKGETQTAFVAGIRGRGAKRNDAEMVGKLGDKLGVDLWKSASETIDTPVLIHKSLMPNGVVDVVKLLDEQNGGTFFGEDKPQEDYVAFRQKCRQREKEMQPTIDKIVADMIARADQLQSPTDATDLLDELSAFHTLEHAITDDRIDARVFGMEAAWFIQDARAHYLSDNMERVHRAKTLAHKVQTSSSCPSGSSKNMGSPDAVRSELDGDNDSEQEVTLEDCDFISKECPNCGKKDVVTKCRKGVYIGDCGCRSK